MNLTKLLNSKSLRLKAIFSEASTLDRKKRLLYASMNDLVRDTRGINNVRIHRSNNHIQRL